jgi:hypothetical protein
MVPATCHRCTTRASNQRSRLRLIKVPLLKMLTTRFLLAHYLSLKNYIHILIHSKYSFYLLPQPWRWKRISGCSNALLISVCFLVPWSRYLPLVHVVTQFSHSAYKSFGQWFLYAKSQGEMLIYQWRIWLLQFQLTVLLASCNIKIWPTLRNSCERFRKSFISGYSEHPAKHAMYQGTICTSTNRAMDWRLIILR